MNSFTDIGQFRNVVKAVREHHDYQGRDASNKPFFQHLSSYPTLTFRGTVKLNGTNSGIVKKIIAKDPLTYSFDFESRENILSLEEDNYGFMKSMQSKDYEKLFNDISFNETCAIFGEWCGQGIQKKVAINQLPKMYVIFAVKIDNVYQDITNFQHLKIEDQQIYNIMQFPHFSMDIDFNNPELSQNKLVELTQNVEKECPVGKYFGISDIGEGIVWEYIDSDVRYIFKVKGEKHQNSKVKTLTTVDVEAITNIKNFVEYAVTENRLMQGIDKMVELRKPIDQTSTADYLRWVYNDVIKEEGDTMIANKIDPKKIGSAISAKARQFWLNYVNTHF